MVVLTHAHACRSAMGAQYEMYSRQRRNIVMQLIRQAAGDGQVGQRGGRGGREAERGGGDREARWAGPRGGGW